VHGSGSCVTTRTWRALWVYPTAYALAQLATGVQCGVAAYLLIVFRGWGFAEALATTVPLGYPLALAQIALFAWALNQVAGSLQARKNTRPRLPGWGDGLEPAYATTVVPVTRTERS
jgi:hypothetical protein